MRTFMFNSIRQALAGAFLAGAATLGAQAQYIGGDLNLDLDESGDVRVLAADVSLQGRVGGDVEGLAADVRIDADIGGDINMASADFYQAGRVGGDMQIAAADITVTGNILGNAQLAGADVLLSGRVEGDLHGAGASVVIDEDAYIGGDVELGGRDVLIRGTIAGGLEVSGREVRISGQIDGPVEIEGRHVFIESSARLGGPVRVEGPNEPVVADGAVLAQGVEYSFAEFRDRDFGDFEGPRLDLDFGPPLWAFGSVFAFSAFVLGMLAALIAPRSVASLATAFRRRPWVSGLLGLVLLAVSPVLIGTLFILLAVTVIGIPLGMILLFAYPIILFMGFALGGIAVADMIFNRKGGQAGLGLRAISFLVVIVAIAALGAIPVLGWLISVIVLCVGLGAWSIAIFSRQISDEETPAAAI